MKILIVDHEVSPSKSKFASTVAEWAKHRELEICRGMLDTDKTAALDDHISRIEGLAK